MPDLSGTPVFRWYRRARIWVAPTLGAAIAFVVGLGFLLLDRFVVSSSTPFLPKFVSSADTARTLLSVTATAVATLTALVLTIVTIVLQLASDKYSHRALRTFLQDRHSHVTLATFVGTFTYAVLALLGLDAMIESDPEVIVSVTIPGAFALAVATIAMFVSYIDHIVHAARGTSIIDRIGSETRAEIDRLYPADLDEDDPYASGALPDGEPSAVIRSPQPGVVYELDTDGLLAWAADADATVVVCPAVGDFIPGGAPLIEVHGDGTDGDGIARYVHLDAERTIRDDVGFGFRLLVDIAEHAISPAINDPTTAVQCVDQLHDLLRRLVVRHFPTGWYADEGGTARLYVSPRSWDDYVSLGCDEIRIYGEGDLQVIRRLRAMLNDLLDIAPDDRRRPLERQLELLGSLGERGFDDEEDVATARVADPQGIGGGTATRAS